MNAIFVVLLYTEKKVNIAGEEIYICHLKKLTKKFSWCIKGKDFSNCIQIHLVYFFIIQTLFGPFISYGCLVC